MRRGVLLRVDAVGRIHDVRRRVGPRRVSPDEVAHDRRVVPITTVDPDRPVGGVDRQPAERGATRDDAEGVEIRRPVATNGDRDHGVARERRRVDR